LELQLRQVLAARLVERRDEYLRGLPLKPKEKAALAKRIGAFLCAEHAYALGRPRQHVETLLAPCLHGEPAFGPALALRAQLWLDRGRLTKAADDVAEALKLRPDEPRALLVRGRIRFEREDPQALADLVRAAELTRGKDAATLHWLAAAQFQFGQRKQAVETQRAAAKLRPGDAEIQEQLREFEKKLSSQ
jgi:tetratricopeptide (TPR) repeat protein